MQKLIFAGDLLPADRQHTVGVGIGSKIDAGELLWSNEITQLFQSSDLSVVNLEAPLVSTIKGKMKNSFAGKPEILDCFTQSGITHVNIANNHILEHGEDAFKYTIQICREKGIQPIGVQTKGASNIVNVKSKDISVAMASFNAIHDMANPGLFAELSEKAVLETLFSKRMQTANIRVLIFHWGNEYIHIPSVQQILLARLAVDNGAHLIIGHHPHVIQPIEIYKDGLICYSLGNFLFDMLWNKSVRTGIILEVDVCKTGVVNWRAHGCRYDRSYHVSVIKQKLINKSLAKWGKQQRKLLARGFEQYETSYLAKVKQNRIFTRILMKVQLLWQLSKMDKTTRKSVVKSIVSKI